MSDDHDQLDPAEALMREVGAQLRQVRLERGQDLDEVGQQLRIKSTYLLGIEEGDLSMMPGRTYALGFLRSYADYLGFDGEDLIVQIKSTVADLTDKTRLRMRTPLPESRLPKTPILVLSLVAVAAIYGGWTYLHRGSQLALETVAQVPASLRHLAGGAFREGGDGVPPPAADVARPLPPPAPAGIEPPAPEAPPPVTGATPAPAIGSSADSAGSNGPAGRPQPGTTAPPPEGMAEAPAAVAPAPPPSAPAAGAPAPPLPAPTTAAQTPPSATGPAAKTQADGPSPPAVAPEGGPGSSTDVAVADAAARPDTPKPPSTTTAPQVLDQGASGAPAAPATDAAAGTRQQQVAALPFDPAVIGPVGQIDGRENTDARVVLKALESSWIQISSPGGDYVRTGTLEPNDVFLVPNRSDLKLWTGNAGGLEVIVDGTVLPPLGTSGAVLRDVSLDPASLRARLGHPPAH